MTALSWVYFCLAVSGLSLAAAFFFARRVIGAGAFLKHHYKTVAALLGLMLPTFASAQEKGGGGEANLTLPPLRDVHFANFYGLSGHALLTIGLLFCAAGLLFGLVIFQQLKNMPVHKSMREMSELIYETCKTYLITQGKFIMLLWVFIAVIIDRKSTRLNSSH